MKVIIAGSRYITDYNILLKAIEEAMYENPNLNITEVVCGEARGVDTLGKNYALKNKIKVKSFFADWNKYGKSAGYRRNQEMAKYGDFLIAIWDGNSKGTKHMIDIMKIENKPIFCHMYKGH